VENLWGGAERAVSELIEPVWAMHPPLGLDALSNMATVFIKEFKSKMMLAALKRYLKQLIDGNAFLSIFISSVYV
jgi:uncharacterized membrane protein